MATTGKFTSGNSKSEIGSQNEEVAEGRDTWANDKRDIKTG